MSPTAEDRRRADLDRIQRTGTTDGVTVAGSPTVLMTYRGATTGTLYRAPLMRVEHGGRYAAVGSNAGSPTNPRWYASLLADPVVELQDGAVTRRYRAREATEDERATWWHRAVDVFPTFTAYQEGTDRRFPILVLDPVSGAPESR